MLKNIAAALALLMATVASAQTVKLRKSFVDSLRHRVTFTDTFEVFKYTGKASEDGDAHGVVSCKTIALPCVAELMNKKEHPAPSSALKNALAQKDSIVLKGVWRMWWEHAGKGNQQQGASYNIETANAAHIFEMHPLLEVDTHKVYASFIPKGFHPPAKAFAAYAKRECTLSADKEYITIQSKMVGYNYVHAFIVKPQLEAVDSLTDGLRFKAMVKDPAGAIVAKEATFVLMAGTPVQEKFNSIKEGEMLEAVIMPRLSFHAVCDYLEKHPHAPVTIPIPYEMVVLGVIE